MIFCQSKCVGVNFLKKDMLLFTDALKSILYFQILYCNHTAQEAYECLTKSPNSPSFIMFRDASVGPPCYQISLRDCLSAIYKCHRLGFFNFEDFCVKEYEHFERVENGDLNWIVPGKFIAFCGPHARSKMEDGAYFPSWLY